MRSLLRNLLILLVVSSVFAKHSLSKNVKKHKQINPFPSIIDPSKNVQQSMFPRRPPPAYIVRDQSANDIYLNQQKQKQYNEIYEKNPEGIHNYDSATKFDGMSLRIIDSISLKINNFSTQTLYLNNLGVLFYANVDGHIREVADSINLMSLVHGNGQEGADNIALGECCSFISSIDANVIMPGAEAGNDGFPSIYNSFQISSGYNTWTIAHSNFSTLLKFQMQLRMLVIHNWYIQFNLVIPSFIWEMNLDAKQTTFRWTEPENWKGECATGKYQSPIGFSRMAAQSIEGNSIKFNYRWAYGAQVRGNAAGNAIELVGDFGHLTYMNGHDERHEFYVTKVTFSTPAEHIIDNNQMNGEMQVHHQGADGTVAIVSFLLNQRPESELKEEQSGAFWSALDYEKWKPNSPEPWTLTRRINLKTIYGKKQQQIKSFFLYKGSESMPPCEEGVWRFIMDQSVNISANYVSLIKRYVAGGMSNSRSIKFFIDVIYFQVDTKQCTFDIDDEEIQELFEKKTEDDRIQIKKVFRNSPMKTTTTITPSFRFKQRLAMRKSHHSRH